MTLHTDDAVVQAMSELAELARSALDQAKTLSIQWPAVRKFAKLACEPRVREALTRSQRSHIASSLHAARKSANRLLTDLCALQNQIARYIPDQASLLKILRPSLQIRWENDDRFLRQLFDDLNRIEHSAAWRAFCAGGRAPEKPRPAPDDSTRSINNYRDLHNDERKLILLLNKTDSLMIVCKIAAELLVSSQKIRKMAIELTRNGPRPLIDWPNTPSGERTRRGMTLTKFGHEIASQIQDVNNAKIK